MKDELGARIKDQYEIRTRVFLPRRTYTIIRIDGKSFHTYTKNLKRPFDADLIEDMDETMMYLCENIQGCKLGYVQSDEISLLLTDFEKETTDAWFDGQVQKMASVSASMVTNKFNHLRLFRKWKQYVFRDDFINVWKEKGAEFDSRIFTIPDPIEVENYFIWRQKDAVRNSIQMLAQSLYSQKELNGKSQNQQQEMCFQKGFNWNEISDRAKRGMTYRLEKSVDENQHSKWIFEPFDFLKERSKLTSVIPKYL